MQQSPTPSASQTPPSAGRFVAAYGLPRSQRRQQARVRIHRQVVRPIDTPGRLPDPLAHASSRLASTVTVARLVVAAVVIHGSIIAVFFAAAHLGGERIESPATEKLVVRIIEEPPPPPPPPDEEPKEVQAPVKPDFVELEPPKPEPPKARRKAKVPEPIVEKEVEVAAPVRHRIVGLNLESTVTGGKGPAFAIGTSRMGQTEHRAVDAKVAAKQPSGGGAATVGQPVRQQRAATRIPTRDSVFVKPRRARPSKPSYPPTLKAQGIEGEVMVRVSIDATGKVTDVAIMRGSGHAAFDTAARTAARAEVFEAATRDGKAVPYTLSYSYRFRIED